MSEQKIQTSEETTTSVPTTQQVVKKTEVMTPEVGTGNPQKDYQSKKAIFRTNQVTWYILGIIEVILTSRILLKLLGANIQSGFTSFIYAISNPLALPFEGILGISQNASSIIEWSTLVAMIVYAVVAYGIVELLQLIKPTDKEEVELNVDSA